MTDSKVSPKQIIDFMDHFVIGNEHPKQMLALALYNHMVRMHYDYLTPEAKEELSKPCQQVLLVTGSSGSGKTTLIRTAANSFGDIPICNIDASALSGEGWQGKGISEYIKEFRNDVGTKAAKYGILYIDEVDKLVMPSDSHRGAYEVMQHNLLSVLDGVHELTKDMLVILSGAFSRLYEHRELGTGARLGFKADHTKYSQDLVTSLTRQELVKFGLIPEFVSRITYITKTTELTDDQIRDVILNVEDSVYNQFSTLFTMSNKELCLSEQQLAEIITEIRADKEFGMRIIKSRMLEKLKNELLELEFTMPSQLILISEDR